MPGGGNHFDSHFSFLMHYSLYIFLVSNLLYLIRILHISALREAPPKKKRVNLGIAQKGGGVKTLAQIVCDSSSVNINHY